jgi:hypothetical protein
MRNRFVVTVLGTRCCWRRRCPWPRPARPDQHAQTSTQGSAAAGTSGTDLAQQRIEAGKQKLAGAVQRSLAETEAATSITLHRMHKALQALIGKSQ